MAYKNVVCSFDYENDRKYYNLLEAWNRNPNIDFNISDCTPSEIKTESVSAIKNVLSRKIGEANYMVAIIGANSNDYHPDYGQIGYRNWQAYEIATNNSKGNGLVVVRLNSTYEVPEEAYGIGAKWVYSFNLDDINNALKELAR